MQSSENHLMYGLRVNRDLAVGSWPFLRFMGLLFDLKDEINPVRSIIKPKLRLRQCLRKPAGLI